jgi:hypothetical protein
MKTKNPIGCTKTNQRGATGMPNKCQYPACAFTVSCSDSELASTRTAASAMP